MELLSIPIWLPDIPNLAKDSVGYIMRKMKDSNSGMDSVDVMDLQKVSKACGTTRAWRIIEINGERRRILAEEVAFVNGRSIPVDEGIGKSSNGQESSPEETSRRAASDATSAHSDSGRDRPSARIQGLGSSIWATTDSQCAYQGQLALGAMTLNPECSAPRDEVISTCERESSPMNVALQPTARPFIPQSAPRP